MGNLTSKPRKPRGGNVGGLHKDDAFTAVSSPLDSEKSPSASTGLSMGARRSKTTGVRRRGLTSSAVKV